MKQFLLIAAACFLLYSCKYFLYHPDEVRPGQKELNRQNIEQLEAVPPKGSFKFILIGDTQRFYDELDEFTAHVNSLDDISFVLLNGDLVDFGLSREYNWVVSKLGKLNIPYLAVIGNHDMLANGRVIFREMFGPENFSFTWGKNKFICLNTNCRETGFNGAIPDISWLEKEIDDTGFSNIFVLSHVPPFSIDFDKSLTESYSKLLSSNPRVRLSMHGHEHHPSISEPYNDGITYLVAGAGNQRVYSQVTVSDTDFVIEQKEY